MVRVSLRREGDEGYLIEEPDDDHGDQKRQRERYLLIALDEEGAGEPSRHGGKECRGHDEQKSSRLRPADHLWERRARRKPDAEQPQWRSRKHHPSGPIRVEETCASDTAGKCCQDRTHHSEGESSGLRTRESGDFGVA